MLATYSSVLHKHRSLSPPADAADELPRPPPLDAAATAAAADPDPDANSLKKRH